MGVAIGDVDGDDRNEILTEDYDENAESNLLRLFEWNGTTYIETGYIPLDAENYALDVGDTNQDGVIEIHCKGIFSGPLDVFGWNGLSYGQEWTTEDFTTFIDECYAVTNIEEGEKEYLIFGELGVFVYEYIGGAYQELWHTAEVPASIKPSI